MKKKTIIITIILILLALAVYGIYKSISTNKIPIVEIINVEKRNITSTISANGEIISQSESDLSFNASGTITNMYAKEGKFVKEGHVLATINSYSAYQNVQATKDARDIALRNKDLFIEQYAEDKDAIGGESEYKIKLRTLNEQISKAEASYKSSLGQITNYSIKAPFDGTITLRNAEVGEVAVPSQIIYKIVDLDNIYFETYVDQEDVGKMKNKLVGKITLDAFPNDELLATVYKISKTSNSNETFTIKLNINEGQTIQPLVGLVGDVKIETNKKENVPSLVFDEYFKDETGYFVWTINDENKLKKIPIELGLEGDIYTEIKTDLSTYTIVLPTEENSELTNDMQVRRSK